MNKGFFQYLAWLTIGYVLLALASWCDDTWAATSKGRPLADQYVQAVYDSLEDKAPTSTQPEELDDQLQVALWQDYEARMPRLEACQYLQPKVNCEAAYAAFWRVYDRLLED